MPEPLIEARGVGRRFPRRGGAIEALADVDLAVRPGEFLVLRGKSGAGKSTLLLALGGLRRPTRGAVLLDGDDLWALSPGERRRRCGKDLGVVFQAMHLLPYLSAEANVALALRFQPDGEARRRARALLGRVGLEQRATHRPDELSVGERQRVALVRALAHGPRVVLADEPTGNLDPESAGVVLAELSAFREAGGAVVLATHAMNLPLERVRETALEDGRLIGLESEPLGGR